MKGQDSRRALARVARTTLLVTGGILSTACAPEPAQAPVDTSDTSREESPRDRGFALVEANGCMACHSLDGTRGIGPSWQGIYGKTVSFTDGRSAVVDEAYLRRAILEPGADVVEGYQNVMVAPSITEAQVADIIAFIGAL